MPLPQQLLMVESTIVCSAGVIVAPGATDGAPDLMRTTLHEVWPAAGVQGVASSLAEALTAMA